jgi:hypothetical protein
MIGSRHLITFSRTRNSPEFVWSSSITSSLNFETISVLPADNLGPDRVHKMLLLWLDGLPQTHQPRNMSSSCCWLVSVSTPWYYRIWWLWAGESGQGPIGCWLSRLWGCPSHWKGYGGVGGKYVSSTSRSDGHCSTTVINALCTFMSLTT